MGTGGGAPCFHDGIDIINHSGVSVFLNVTPSELVNRLESKSDRPLLSRESNDELFEKISQLHRKRLPIYQKASITIEEATVEKIIEQLAALT
jgi:shikimate kinase